MRNIGIIVPEWLQLRGCYYASKLRDVGELKSILLLDEVNSLRNADDLVGNLIDRQLHQYYLLFLSP